MDIKTDVARGRALSVNVCQADSECYDDDLADFSRNRALYQLPEVPPWTVAIETSGVGFQEVVISAALYLSEEYSLAPDARLAWRRTKPIRLPVDGLYAYSLPMSYLCGGVDPITKRPGGCRPLEAEPVPLPDLQGTPEQLSGECFDTAACYSPGRPIVDEGAYLPPPRGELVIPQWNADRTKCIAESRINRGPVNVAMVTRFDHGPCGDAGCYVSLDADQDLEAPLGPYENRFELPQEVCRRLEIPETDEEFAFKVDGVVIADVTGECPSKVSSLYPCNVDSYKRIVLAPKIDGPVSIALSSDEVFWTSGVYGSADGFVKTVPKKGGIARSLAQEQAAPRDLAVRPDGSEVLWTNAGTPGTSGAIMLGKRDSSGSGYDVDPWIQNLDMPEGIAASKDLANVLWSGRHGAVWRCKRCPAGYTCGGNAPCTAMPERVDPGALTGHPSNMVVDLNFACWIGAVVDGSGVVTDDAAVKCLYHESAGEPVTLDVNGLADPWSLAMSTFESGYALGIYATDFNAGMLRGGDLNLSEPGGFGVYITSEHPVLDVPLAGGSPYGVAIDETHVYWTSWDKGLVSRCSRQGTCVVPEIIATGQNHPTRIAVDSEAIYWINQGSYPGARDGSVNRRRK